MTDKSSVSPATHCEYCGLAASSLLHRFCTHSNCPNRAALKVASGMNSEAENRLGQAERDQTASSGKPHLVTAEDVEWYRDETMRRQGLLAGSPHLFEELCALAKKTFAPHGESPDEWYERERAAFIAWWESEGQEKFGETPTLAAGAGWLARAEAASAVSETVHCHATDAPCDKGCTSALKCARIGSETPRITPDATDVKDKFGGAAYAWPTGAATPPPDGMCAAPTFEDWWKDHGYDYVTTKNLARDAWFAWQKVVNDHESGVSARSARVLLTDEQIMNAACTAADALDATRVSEMVPGGWKATTIFEGDTGLLRFGRLIEEAINGK